MKHLRLAVHVALIKLRLPKMTEPSDDFIAAWEHILADVTKTDVPLECIKKVVLKFHGGRQRTFNLATLKKQGVSIEEIETMLTRTFDEQNDQIRDVDFVVDVVAVANLVQPETNKILHGLK
jgi:hypothetical protein